jgi:SsrA-binding protein
MNPKGIYIKNKKVFFEYEVIETSCGIQLQGTEVKMIREGKVSLVDGYCFFNDGELFVKNLLISESKSHFTHDPKRDKKLLLKKRELNKIQGKLVKGLSLIPTLLLTNERGLIKLEIILGRGKKLYDKRESLKLKDIKRTQNCQLKIK